MKKNKKTRTLMRKMKQTPSSKTFPVMRMYLWKTPMFSFLESKNIKEVKVKEVVANKVGTNKEQIREERRKVRKRKREDDVCKI